MKKLIVLKDGFISDIRDDFDQSEEYSGCPTCGWNNEYISEIEFLIHRNEYDKAEWFKVKAVGYVHYEFTVSEVLILFIENMDQFKEMEIDEFKIWVEMELIK